MPSVVTAHGHADAAPTRAGARPLVAAHSVVVRISGRTILDNVSLNVSAGEIVSLIGPNGAGKTTLVRALLGLTRCDTGTITRAPALTIGYVPQRLAIDPVLPISVRRFLALAQAARGGGRRARREGIAAALAEVGSEHLLDQPLESLSGGEFRRVLLARALLRDPDLLVLDEPVQQVDFAGQLAMYELIGAIRARRGCGILVVSHDLHLVMAATDRVLCINRHVCCAGRPEAVSQHPDYIALFGPSAARELAVYAHAHDHAHDIDGEIVPLDTRE